MKKSGTIWEWEQNAGSWIGRAESGDLVYQQTNRFLIDTLKVYRPMRVCDIGCGEGTLTREISHNLFDVSGIDGASRFVSFANEKDTGTFFNTSYEQIVHEGTLPGGGYDTALFNFSLDESTDTSILSTLRQCLVGTKKIIIQSLHPLTLTKFGQSPSYRDHWRQDYLRILTGDPYCSDHSWYARTLEGWFYVFSKAQIRLLGVREGMLSGSTDPFSIIFILSAR